MDIETIITLIFVGGNTAALWHKLGILEGKLNNGIKDRLDRIDEKTSKCPHN